MDMMKHSNVIICDIGASAIKVGFVGPYLTPEHVIPTVMAIPRQNGSPILLGKEALRTKHRKKYSYIHPIDEYGVVQNWKALEALLEYSLCAIGLDIGCSSSCQRHKILLTKSRAMKLADTKRVLELFFKKFQFSAVTMHDQAALVLYTQGVETGLVVELGDTMTTIVPVYQGYAISKLNKTMDVGGRSITQYLIKLLRRQGYHMDTREDLESARDIKEGSCYVALEPTIEERLGDETTILDKSIRLHDGTKITIGKERFEATEILFQPKLWDSEQSGLANLIFDTIQESPIDCRVDLYQNIILSGGSSLLPGLQDRLEHDLMVRYQKDVVVQDTEKKCKHDDRLSGHWTLQVHAPDTRQFAVYQGAALFADLIQSEPQFWVTAEEYKTGRGMQVLLENCQIR